jgi:hypothetical protein
MRARLLLGLAIAGAIGGAAHAQGPTIDMRDEGTGGSAPARLDAAASALQGSLSTVRPLSVASQKNLSGSAVYLRQYAFAGDPTASHVFLTSMQGSSVCHVRVPKGTTAERLTTFIVACVQRLGVAGGSGQPSVGATASGGGAAPVRMSAAARRAARAGVPNSHPENWRNVAGVYFYRGVSLGYGGAVGMTFRPVVLFNDSSYYEIDDAPLEDIDLAAERAAHPSSFGRWSRRGVTFTLYDQKGRGNDYALGTGNFFKAYPATAKAGLSGSYSNVSGGGNSSIGGSTGYLADSRMNFRADGAYTTGQSVAFSQTPEQTGVSITGASRNPARSGGRYATDRYTLTLTGADGSQLRRFFCFSSDGRSGALDTGMIFVGDSGYTRKG